MTDTKATPATEVRCVNCGSPLGYSWTWCQPCQFDHSKRIDADRETIRKQAAEIERLKQEDCDCYRVHDDFCTLGDLKPSNTFAELATLRDQVKAKDEEIERLKGDHAAWMKFRDSMLAEAHEEIARNKAADDLNTGCQNGHQLILHDGSDDCPLCKANAKLATRCFRLHIEDGPSTVATLRDQVRVLRGALCQTVQRRR